MPTYDLIETEGSVPIKAWTQGVLFEGSARWQVAKVAMLPIVGPHVAVMPDVHAGIGCTVGSVVPTVGAIIVAAVGVDIGCGVIAARTTLTASDLPDNLAQIREHIEKAVPHGRTKNGKPGLDRGAWGNVPGRVANAWSDLEDDYKKIVQRHRHVDHPQTAAHLGTLGGGNHLIEVCLDEAQRVWILLHSGSRGVGNKIGTYFTELARRDMEEAGTLRNLPDRDLAYLSEGTKHFDDYVAAVSWAQEYALVNRRLMLLATADGMAKSGQLPRFSITDGATNCHLNYIARARHFDRDLYITRKGAVRAGKDEMGVVLGSMGTPSFVVRGKGNPESFETCSHGAGRCMSRTQAKQQITLKMHADATAHVECRKDKDVLDESPAAYKDVRAVIAAQSDLIEVVHELTQVVCVKG